VAVKFFELADIGTIRVTKRSGSRNLRLSITPEGEVRVSIPQWSPYQSGVEFARSRADWIRKNLPEREAPLSHGHRIGKAHRLAFVTAATDVPSSRLVGTEIRISRPHGMAGTHPDVQKVARRASIRALRAQAEALLPKRLRTLADSYGFDYASVSVKQLKGRWGSCDNSRNIVLNLFLMQLPWQLIDYVLLHELVHTKHLSHGAEFWREFLRHNPNAKGMRAEIRRYKPVLLAVDSLPAVA
jgi:predicted metal-dependent hydrolase